MQRTSAIVVAAASGAALSQLFVLPSQAGKVPRTSKPVRGAPRQPAANGSLPVLGAGAVAGAFVALRTMRRSGRSLRSQVARAAKAQTKPKNKAKDDAVAKAMAALQALEEKAQVAAAAPKLKKERVTRSKTAPSEIFADENGSEKEPEPAQSPAETPAAQHEEAPVVAAVPEVQAEAPKEPEPAHEEPAAPVAEEAAAVPEEPEPLPVVAEAAAPVAEERHAVAEAPEEPPQVEQKPAVPRPTLNPFLSTLAGLGDVANDATANGRAKSAPSSGARKLDTADVFSRFTMKEEEEKKAEAERKKEEERQAKIASGELVEEEPVEEEPVEEESDSEEEDDEEEEPKEPVRRRRGDKIPQSFVLESTSSSGKEVVFCGLENVAVRFGGRLVLQDANWRVQTGERLALVGPNGCGKTTQLRVLTGEIIPDEGGIIGSRPDLKLSVLEQSFVDDLNPNNSVMEELMAAIPEEKQLLDEMKDLQAKIASLEGVAGKEDELEALITRLTDIQPEAERLRVYEIEDRLQRVIQSVGFFEEDLSAQVGLLSGGWKVRLGLAKIFMVSPDVLLLDEPTNHLDLDAVEWLEGFLRNQELPIVFVSHDREFMDRVATRIVDTMEGVTYGYTGGYSAFIQKRDERMETWQKKYEAQEKKVKELEQWIKEHKGEQMKANARNLKIRELEKMKASDDYLDPPPRFFRRIRFKFPEPPQGQRGGLNQEACVIMRDVTHGYGEGQDEVLFEGASLIVGATDKIGIVGGNGTGKSTLLRLMMGVESPSGGGKVMAADPQTTLYFTQHQADLLPSDKTAIQVVKEGNELMVDDQKLKDIMRKFRFKGDRLDVKVESLSGGEKARLAIVRMMLQPSRCLIFDEPTNHLDVPMKETLEYSVREYPGAAVVVSHDRWFLSQTCKKIVEIKDGKVVEYEGDFRYYMDNNNSILRKIEGRYIRGQGGIMSVPAAGEERRVKEVKIRKDQLQKNYLKYREQQIKEQVVYRKIAK